MDPYDLCSRCRKAPAVVDGDLPGAYCEACRLAVIAEIEARQALPNAGTEDAAQAPPLPDDKPEDPPPRGVKVHDRPGSSGRRVMRKGEIYGG
ncbi:MAG: hypothetical protein KGL39_35840 [Patescibacteria group bacterium]|nr:hypothetical protein [Patescibacteria group bacterium]